MIKSNANTKKLTETPRGRICVIAAIMTVIVALMGISAAAAVPNVHAYVAAGNTYGNVAAVQTRLKTLGYYTRTVDGVWGSNTYAAV